MNIYKYFKDKKLLVFNLFMIIYITSNLISGERGLIAFFEKKEKLMILENENYSYKSKLENLKAKNLLLSKSLDIDYLDTLYRKNLKVGTQNEIIIKLNSEK